MNKQIEFWQGPHGDIYQQNEISAKELTSRTIVWSNIITQMKTVGRLPTSFLEVGPAQGTNLKILKALYEEMELPVKLSCVEVNKLARDKLWELGLDVYEKFPTNIKVDCSFTYGVLIHTHPDNLVELMAKMYRRTNKYICCFEYFSPATVPFLNYYGGKDLTWAADYGRCWVEEFGVSVLSYGFCWDYATKMDNIVYWVMEK